MYHRRAATEQLAADLGQAVMHLFPHKKQRTQERLLSCTTRLQALPLLQGG